MGLSFSERARRDSPGALEPAARSPEFMGDAPDACPEVSEVGAGSGDGGPATSQHSEELRAAERKRNDRRRGEYTVRAQTYGPRTLFLRLCVDHPESSESTRPGRFNSIY